MATGATQQTGVEVDVLRADDRRFEAMRTGDWATVRYLAVYAKGGEHWRMIAWQSTRQD